jgi:DNA-binding PadR family transcriptional regulator
MRGAMASMRDLSELEGCVLGLVWSREPCTAYSIRREFLDSPSPQWSGSAGAIYPLVERLERLKLIRSAAHARGKRRSWRLSLTPAGRRTLERWLGPPHSRQTLGVPSDPLRTRVEFLGALSAWQRKRFLTEAERGLATHLRVVEQDCARRRRAGELPAYLAALGARGMLRARLEWLREAARLHGKKNGLLYFSARALRDFAPEGSKR